MNSELRLIPLPEVIYKTGLSRSLIYDKIKKGEFPKNRRLSHRCSRWAENEINEWIQDQLNPSK